MTTPVSFFLLAALLTIANRGSSIECQTCSAIHSNCTGSVKVCDPEFDACSSVMVETNTSTKTLKVIRKKCTTQNQCTPGAILMDLEIGYQEAGNSICCTMDHCNTASLTVPTRNKTLNGLWCPFCYAEEYETCKEEIISCRGLENQCFTREAGGQRVTTKNSVTTISYQVTQKGCATKPFCAEQGLLLSRNQIVYGAQEIQCRAASHEARPADSGGQKTVDFGARRVFKSPWLCLQAFARFLMITSFYQCLF
ncbi:phospholipase A2 inhibitor and Ly6/PLAUR domain-containing protein-like [Heteronotia binoei]|uniref:phospholipase A2 inhibitor and Ly6/PLAUR domain-containing protein-like n=1 Tax=Heteronotia binoei TaxID=13085 RepID=UPI00292EDB16|nr:phospholipase A2 inhibitor and Ly6/PLAUR domain-containing protein-like [Heteronotia binoei]